MKRTSLNDEGEELFSGAEVFPEEYPGMVLRGCRYRDEMTQEELAERLGITQTRISELESGKRAISVSMAKRLAKVFKTTHKVFL